MRFPLETIFRAKTALSRGWYSIQVLIISSRCLVFISDKIMDNIFTYIRSTGGSGFSCILYTAFISRCSVDTLARIVATTTIIRTSLMETRSTDRRNKQTNRELVQEVTRFCQNKPATYLLTDTDLLSCR